MATFRQALRTLDADLLEKGYQQWLRKPVNQDRVARATGDLVALETSLAQRYFYLKDQPRWSQREVLAAIEKLSPEIIYHLWREERTAHPYPESRQFPIPFKQATQYLKLMQLFVFQHHNDPAVEWSGYYEEVVSSTDEVASWLLTHMEGVSTVKDFPVERLGAHRMFRLEHADRLFMLNENSLIYMAKNRHLTAELLRWVWEKMEEKVEERLEGLGAAVLQQLAQNTATAITSDVCDQMWEFYSEHLLPNGKTYTTIASYLADNPVSSDNLLLRLAEGGFLSGVPKNRDSVSEQVIRILLQDRRKSTRLWTARNELAAPCLEVFLEEQKEVKVEMLASIALNTALSPELLSRLAQNRTIKVRSHVAKNLSITFEVAETLAYDRSKTVRKEVAYNRAVPVSLRFMAEPTEKQFSLCLKADRDGFLDWMEVTYPELAGLPQNLLIQIVPTLVAEQVELSRAEVAKAEFI